METFAAKINAWWKQPFREQGSVLDWFWFVGLLAALGIIWKLILSHMDYE